MPTESSANPQKMQKKDLFFMPHKVEQPERNKNDIQPKKSKIQQISRQGFVIDRSVLFMQRLEAAGALIYVNKENRDMIQAITSENIFKDMDLAIQRDNLEHDLLEKKIERAGVNEDFVDMEKMTMQERV